MKVLTGFIMDLLWGDPDWIPHPVLIMGSSIKKLRAKIQKWIYGCTYQEWKEEGGENKKAEELLGGGFLMTVLAGGAFLITYSIIKLAKKIHPRLGDAVETFFIFQTLATKGLRHEIMKVYKKLKEEDLEGARTEIGYLVGRDTDELNPSEIVKAAVETVAENTADGVVCPLFYAAIGGAPLAMAYKAVNTLDSMVGYNNEEYQYLGRASARMDDLWNYIPSRLSAIAMLASAKAEGYDAQNAWKIFKRDRYNHLSPNSAQTESVAAGALDIQLGGTHSYFGEMVEKPTIGDNIRSAETEDIRRTCNLLYGTAILSMAVVALIKGLRYLHKKWNGIS